MAHFGSPLKLAPSEAKRSRIINNWNLCIICQVSTNEKLSTTTLKERQTLLSSVNTRKDYVYRRLLEEFSSLNDIDTERLFYHKSCYKTYTSKINLEKFSVNEKLGNSSCSTDTELSVQTRSMSTLFDWSTCIFCQHRSYKGDRQLRQIETDDRYKKIVETADQKRNFDIKLLISTENFKSKAFYHRACIANFLLNTPKKEETNEEPTLLVHDQAFERLLLSIDNDLIVHKKAFLMSYLLEMFCSFLPQDSPIKYTSAKLQRRLEKHYGDSIVIQTQQGQGRSNIVYSSTISVSEAILAASHLKSELRLSEFEAEMAEPKLNEEQILHAAASILRSKIQSVDITNEIYPNPSDVSLAQSTQNIPVALIKLLSWLIDDKC